MGAPPHAIQPQGNRLSGFLETRRVLREYLTARESSAARELVQRVRRLVWPELVQASLFGSKARFEARADSDVDVLLVFRALPPDREPYATQAEDLAERVSRRTRIPITVWSVSLPDLVRGRRTPMLVDALADSVPLWFSRAPLPQVRFTPADARTCLLALSQRVDEGSVEFAAALRAGDVKSATRRARDDVVRLCTAVLLASGVTRPRRADAVRACARRLSRLGPLPVGVVVTLRWAIDSFGPSGRDDEVPVPVPLQGPAGVAATIDWLRHHLDREAAGL